MQHAYLRHLEERGAAGVYSVTVALVDLPAPLVSVIQPTLAGGGLNDFFDVEGGDDGGAFTSPGIGRDTFTGYGFFVSLGG